MGTVSFRVTAYGMTEREAHENALDADREENGTKDGYNGGMNSARGGVNSKCLTPPKVGKPKFTKAKHASTTRKWETRYCVYYDTDYGRYEGRVGHKLTQGDAVTMAKEYTAKSGRSCKIVIEKVCTSYNSTVGTVEASGASLGKWVFWGEARE